MADSAQRQNSTAEADISVIHPDDHTSATVPPKPADTSRKQRIILCMIVKNESKIIERCLKSCLGVVEGISICDTGSTDNTVEIIKTFATKNNLKCRVHHETFKNFSHNRTLAFELAKKVAIEEWKYDPDMTYQLFLDADMAYVSKPFPKTATDFSPKDSIHTQKLTKAGYQLWQSNGGSDYTNLRLAKCSIPWKCVRRTHEFWSCEPFDLGQLEVCYLDDFDDGGAKSDKYERDLRLLLEDLKELGPEDGRSLFYLGQTLQGLGERESDLAKREDYLKQSMDYYKRRIRLTDFHDEIWFAYYMIEVCNIDLALKYFDKKADLKMTTNEIKEKHDEYLEQATVWCRKAMAFDGSRREPLWKMAELQRKIGNNADCYMYAKRALRIPYPRSNNYRIARDAYISSCEWEISVSAYYDNDTRDEGRRISEQLLVKKDVPADTLNQVRWNLQFYLTELKPTNFVTLDCERIPLEKGCGYYYQCNPCIVRYRDGYLVNVRHVNFTFYAKRYFAIGTDVVNTHNTLLRLSSDFKVISSVRLQDVIGGDVPSKVRGHEDVRLIEGLCTDDRVWFTSTLRYTHDAPQQVLCEVDLTTGKFLRKVLLNRGDATKTEKNWSVLPTSMVDDKLPSTISYIYNHNPMEIDKFDLVTGKLLSSQVHTLPFVPKEYRGSCAPIKVRSRWIGMVHEVIMIDNYRNYIHRWVEYDEVFALKRFSNSFNFLIRGFEYVNGMCLSHDSEHIVLGLGINDNQACLCLVQVDTVLESLYSFNPK
jgi:glycosyltransferase involved in cell wall biosynthesis